MRLIRHYLQTLTKPKPHKLSLACTYTTLQSDFSRNPSPNLTFPPARNFQISSKHANKIFINAENQYAFSLLPPIKALEPELGSLKHVKSATEFEEFLARNWRQTDAAAIVGAFEAVKDFCKSNNVNISDHRFDKLVDGLVDHCEKLTDGQLLKLIYLMGEFPQCPGLGSHNFEDAWTCLDDICCWKMSTWSLEKMFTFANAWNCMHMGGVCDYVTEVLDRTRRKPHKFSKSMLLYAFYYTSVSRRFPVKFELEEAIAGRVNEFTMDELAVIALGYFKTQTKIKTRAILQAMIDGVAKNGADLNSITLTALLKAIRLTQNLEAVDDTVKMLDALTPKICKLPTVTCVHVALVGVGLQLKHEPTLLKCLEKIATNIESTRLKDIERTLLVSAMFDIDTTPSIYERALKELSKPSRRPEFIRHNRCLPSALNYLSQRNLYSYELMDELFDEEFIRTSFGKGSKTLPRELISLDACISIECPDYKGRRLAPAKRYTSVKWHLEFAPDPNYPKKLSLPDRFYLNVVEHIKGIVGAEKCIRHDYVLPHFSKTDIILCKSLTSGEFVEPFGFQNYILGDVKRPLNLDNFEWYAIMVLTPNQCVRSQNKALGALLMKQRQLKAIGYKPVLVFFSEFCHLSNDDKTALLLRKLAPETRT